MIIVTYIDKRTGAEDIEKFPRTPNSGTKQQIAFRGLQKLYGKKWRLKYQLLNVADDDPSKEGDEIEETDE